MTDLDILSSDDNLTNARPPHCSHCGHPGSKRGHLKVVCEYCDMDGLQNCIEKPAGFRCKCPTCDRVHPYSLSFYCTWSLDLHHSLKHIVAMK